MTLLEDNRGGSLDGLGHDDDPTYSTKGTIHDFRKVKNYSAKGKSQECKKTSLGLGQNICPPPKKYICMFNKEFLSKVYKELLKFNKKANNLILR